MNNWKRYELKDRAKKVLKVNYWLAFVVALIFVVVSGGISLPNTGWRTSYSFNEKLEYNYDLHDEMKENISEKSSDDLHLFSEMKDLLSGDFIGWIMGIFIAFVFIAMLVGLALDVFVLNPLKMGCLAFFKTSAEEPHNKMTPVGMGFKGGNYKSVVKTMFLRNLYTFLWSLLFVIPGIIKSYAYRMVPYILADNPKMDANEAITLSRKMMMGEKWKTFVLDLSFLGWYLLGFIALIVGMLFVHPYKFATDAQLYLVLREKAFNEDLTTQDRLNVPLV